MKKSDAKIEKEVGVASPTDVNKASLKDVPTKRYISPEERQQIIGELRSVPKRDVYTSRNYWWIKVNVKELQWLCDYSDSYRLVKERISVNNTATEGAAANNIDKKVIFKNCASFTNCISKINNTQVDNAENIDLVMTMYNLEYNDNYSKTCGGLWQYCKDIPAVNNNGNIVDFSGANATTNSLVNLEVNFILTWSENCVIIVTNFVNQVPTFEITETSFYVPVVTLATQNNAKLLSQLKSGFKRIISWNKHLSKPELLPQNPNLNHLIEPSLPGVNFLINRLKIIK